jgi:hypothetical protein
MLLNERTGNYYDGFNGCNGFFLNADISRFRQETLDFGLWTLDFGLWTLDFGLWTLDFGLWTLDFGLWTLDFGLWTFLGAYRLESDATG